MVRGPLAQKFAIGPRVHFLVYGYSGEVICRNVTNTAAAGLNGVHPYLGKISEDIGYLFKLWPIELDILSRT